MIISSVLNNSADGASEFLTLSIPGLINKEMSEQCELDFSLYFQPRLLVGKTQKADSFDLSLV